VQVGRWSIVIALIVAELVAPALKTLDQAYQFIQEYVGFISPGVLAIFLMGFFWRRTTSLAALTGTLLTIPVSTLLKFLPSWTNGAFPDFPFLDRMSITFAIIIAAMVIVSLIQPAEKSFAIEIDFKMFRVNRGFVIGSAVVFGILVALYTFFW
jgi:SSS family solute:Na+ symporter